MSKVLFIPLNGNHVSIFKNVIDALKSEYTVLCHDRISDAPYYHTEQTLKTKRIPYIHFERELKRSTRDNLAKQIADFFRMKKLIRNTIKKISPSQIVLGIDNDPVARVIVKEAKKNGIGTILIPEGLIRLYWYTGSTRDISDWVYKGLECFGIYLRYSKYGTSGCDRILVSGRRAMNILKKQGVPEGKMAIVGQPKYDEFVRKLESRPAEKTERRTYLFAASNTVVKDDANVTFLRKLIECIESLGFFLIVKLHPRTPQTPEDIYKAIGKEKSAGFEIIKEGDDTLTILQKSYGLITINSTVMIEALMLNKEGIAVNYLAEGDRLDYDEYDAIYCIDREQDILEVLKMSAIIRKSDQNKRRLLEDELYRLDGKAGVRVANLIDVMV